MYYYVFLLCTLLVPFTQSYTLVNNVEDDFSIDDVTDYEVVPVRHMLHKRSINELTLHTKINGKEREIYLQPTEGLLAGTGTKIFTASRGYQREVDFKLEPNIMNNIFLNFYQDPKSSSSITHSVNKYGNSEFNGIINRNMVIRPLPKHLRQRRDLLKSNTSSFESVADGFIETTEHIIFKQVFKNASQLSAPKMYNDEASNIKNVSRRSAKELPKIVYPEIMVFVDDILFKKFNYDMISAVEYTLSFWNGVDLRFREFEKPKIRLNIAGIVLIKEPLPFIRNGIANLGGDRIYTDLSFKEFKKFLDEDKVLQHEKNYDIAMLITGRDMVDDQTGESSVAGYATVGGVCMSKENGYYQYSSCGVAEDQNGYGGINTVAHELGHILGAPHDEEEFTSSGGSTYNTKYCRQEEGYIMSYNHNTKSKILFSPCSKQVIRDILSQDFAKCVQNNPAEYENNKPLPRILPGQLMSLDQQCKNFGYIRCNLESTTCLDLWCVNSQNGGSYTSISSRDPPAEGSSCGEGKYCLSGECVDIVKSYSDKPNYKPVTKRPYKKPVVPKNPIITRVPTTTVTPVFVQRPKNVRVTPKHTIKVCTNGDCEVKEVDEAFFNNFVKQHRLKYNFWNY
ncbi:venom metalloproteinase antarease-like TtrivMP_A [Leptopilina heterotoma]|uniref:venom metalloproteinase antarease-like TtrivMP_A n=1 Tax=Leptopilina heterotoma TaxID=63436 RepID=UPI001CA826E2|nr:venom metalloproteinase antarease-like TtrivMP_A [Leptopilina heterotoma]